ncbi:hypothetical protein [Bacillus sp. JCM 19034]|uniref:hypothetical protein n=1 Tax=Bacillus sp. JCM 19034 TaxID=1481928 RepID=UPI000784DED6|nr:hypothetical protein [Bacillus sp. JCM 19034]
MNKHNLIEAFDQLKEAIKSYERNKEKSHDLKTVKQMKIFIKEKEHFIMDEENHSLLPGQSVSLYYKRKPISHIDYFHLKPQPFNQWIARGVWKKT